ncbi:MAG TPA: penicillin-insensitive murein endopeptidase [Myxococcota bacterium]|jgi:penicillin-insensitive murein endopeptidase|nr:penicillin-insensitive murein endopeptidase [Myxococcota bacterium]
MRGTAALAALTGSVLLLPLAAAATGRHGSVAVGRTNAGSLRGATDVTAAPGPLRLLPKVRPRDLRFTTDEMAAALHRAAAAVATTFPGSVLSVGNLSARTGGRIPYSVSHQNGLDADLVFYLRDAHGAFALPDGYLHVGADLRARGAPTPGWRFDVARNWALVAALLADPTVRVQWMFIAEPLRTALLDEGRRAAAPAALLARAARVLHQPSDAPAHDDHLHLRLYCPTPDRALGCEDRGP